jgi:ATP-dependent RNA helicase SUPV3L1/SUV3
MRGTFERHEVVLMLGPTNTGKTFRAIERMLEHDSAMIGLPLRLLAREVYDRMVQRAGEDAVALITGEEKRVPRAPRYWVATVEAMPADREVDFLVVDEIQLCGHPERGHVFTERLLHARGRKETWFLGSHAAESLLRELVPAARVESHPRLSSLRFAGAERLGRLPKRCALVAFSMNEVYRLAERVRSTHGGAAVVMGALSPRTRNAQVALFESGEVDHLVATDAIGMGLNLDVHHVAFSALSKFDGREERELEPNELAQIAGRAGRYLRDGTFGTLAPRELPHKLAQSIEAHVLPPVRRAYYRNARLDFASIDALLHSLGEAPRQRGLTAYREALDQRVLERLASLPELRGLSSRDVRLLWDVAQTPDYRKLLFESHVELVKRLFLLLREGALRDEEMERSVKHLRQVEGDESVLVDRIADTRTWTYVSHHAGWVANAAHWQEQTRALEDQLSEQLHQRLVSRFIDATKKKKKLRPINSFASLAALLDQEPELVDPTYEGDLALRADGSILCGGEHIAQLSKGANILRPNLKWIAPQNARTALEERVQLYLSQLPNFISTSLVALESVPALRGIHYGLAHGLGTVRTADDEVLELKHDARTLLARAGIVWGRVSLYDPASLREEALRDRAVLSRLWFETDAQLPNLIGRAQTTHDRFLWASGYAPVGTFVVRVDVLEEGLIPAVEGTIQPKQVRDALGLDAAQFDLALRETRALLDAVMYPRGA